MSRADLMAHWERAILSTEPAARGCILKMQAFHRKMSGFPTGWALTCEHVGQEGTGQNCSMIVMCVS